VKRRNFISLCAMAAVGTYAKRPLFAADNKIQLPSSDAVHVGGSKRIEIGGGHWVWTKKVGIGDIKVLLLHGGPGADHRYFEGFEDFLPLNGIEFYYYDQLDSTNSERTSVLPPKRKCFYGNCVDKQKSSGSARASIRRNWSLRRAIELASDI
jgi:proline iminopeptidase